MEFRGVGDKQSHLFWDCLDWFSQFWAEEGVKTGKDWDKIWLLWMKGSIPGEFLFVLTTNPFFPGSHINPDVLWHWMKNGTETRLGFGGVGGQIQQQSSHTPSLVCI